MTIKAEVPDVISGNNTPQGVSGNVRKFRREGAVEVRSLKMKHHQKLAELRSVEDIVKSGGAKQIAPALLERIENISHELGLYREETWELPKFALVEELVELVRLKLRVAIKQLELRRYDREERLRMVAKICEGSDEILADDLGEIALLLDVPIQEFYKISPVLDRDRR